MARVFDGRDDRSFEKPAFGVGSEFGRLREAVVGIAEDLALPPMGRGLTHFNDELAAALSATGGRALDIREAFPARWEETQNQMDGVAATFERFGVKVHRPRPYGEEEKRHQVELQPGHSLLYPADPVFVIGKHFLELSIRRAYRRKEVFPLRDIVQPMIEADRQAHYVAMPPARPWTPAAEGPGPFLEGGDILIAGRDIIVGHGHLCSNLAGVESL